MAKEKKPLIRPRNVAIALIGAVVLVLGGYAYFLADMGGYLPWQEDPTPIANDVTPFSGAGFENLPTIPPKRSATAEPTSAVASPSAATPAASPAGSPASSPVASAPQGFTLAAAQTVSAIPETPACEICT